MAGVFRVREVTVDESSGKKQLDLKMIEAARKAGLIVVAIHGGNPISVAKSAIPPEPENQRPS